MCSGPEDQDWPNGDWIPVTFEQYNVPRPDFHVIINGEIVCPTPTDSTWVQLEKADSGQFTSLKDNIIFVSNEGDHYRIKTYE